MQIRFGEDRHGRRWQVETVVSMIKRRARFRNHRPKLLVSTPRPDAHGPPHNIVNLFARQGFLQSSPDTFPRPLG